MPSVSFEQKLNLKSSGEHIRSLSLALYRVTNKIPETEPLRVRLRKEVLILISTVEKISSGNVKKYPAFLSTSRTLIQYCDIARQQNWLDEKNFAVLKDGFLNAQKLVEDSMAELALLETQIAEPSPAKESVDNEATFVNVFSETEKAPAKGGPGPPFGVEDLTGRQKALLDFITQKKVAKIGDLESIAPDVTDRTLRRDMEALAKTGYIRKFGRTNRTYYKLVRTRT